MHVHAYDVNRMLGKIERIGYILGGAIQQHAPAFAQHPKRNGAIVRRRIGIRLKYGKARDEQPQNECRESQKIPPEENEHNDIMRP